MKECHVCLNLCDDDAVLCPVCGAELRDAPAGTGEDAAEKTGAQNSENGEIVNPVLAVSADSPVTAEIFKDILDENGIAFSVDEKGDFLHTGFGGGFFAIDIYVDEKNLEIAKELYSNLSESDFSFDDFEDFESDGSETDGE